MSRNNASRSYKIQDLFKQVSEMDEGEMYSLYGLEKEDDTFFDTCYGKAFDDLMSWVIFNVDMEALEEKGTGVYSEYEDE